MEVLQLDKDFFGANKERGGRCRIWNSNRGTESALLTRAATSCTRLWSLDIGFWRSLMASEAYTNLYGTLTWALCESPKINCISFRWFVFSAPLKTWQPSLSLKAISMHISFISQWLVIFSESVIFNIYLSLKLLSCKYYKNELRGHGEFVMIYLPQ